jgi:ornithine--oxo-acid transaminase
MLSIDHPLRGLVRGKGLLNAVVIEPLDEVNAWEVCIRLMDHGVLAKPTHQHIIRFAPPLVITDQQMEVACSIIKKVITSFPA